MDLLQQIQGMLGNIPGGGASAQPASQQSSGLPGGLSNLLGPAMLGGLAGALLTSKAARGIAGGALLAGAGAALWNKYKDRMRESAPDGAYNTQASQPGQTPGGPRPSGVLAPGSREQAERLVRALVYAAKSDGHIDEKEQAAIYGKLQSLNIGTEAQTLVQQALNESLDPDRIAGGITDANEALQIYTLSCAVVEVDNFMERSYLDGLAAALKIPDDVKNDIEQQVRSGS